MIGHFLCHSCAHGELFQFCMLCGSNRRSHEYLICSGCGLAACFEMRTRVQNSDASEQEWTTTRVGCIAGWDTEVLSEFLCPRCSVSKKSDDINVSLLVQILLRTRPYPFKSWQYYCAATNPSATGHTMYPDPLIVVGFVAERTNDAAFDVIRIGALRLYSNNKNNVSFIPVFPS